MYREIAIKRQICREGGRAEERESDLHRDGEGVRDFRERER